MCHISNYIRALARNIVLRNKASNAPYILFLGAGASKTSGCSSMMDIVDDIVKVNYGSEFKNWEIEIENANELSEEFGEFKKIKINEQKRSHFLKVWETLDNETRQSILIKHLQKDAKPSEGYLSLVQLIKNGFIKTIFSTNLDNLLERALSNAGYRQQEDYITIVNGKDRQEEILEQLNSPRIPVKIIKLHGSLESPTSYAFTEKEIYEFERKIKSEISRFINQSLIIVGYNVRDHDVNVLFEEKGNEIYFVNPTMPKEESEISRILSVRGKGKIIDGINGNFDTFFEKLLMCVNDEEKKLGTPKTLYSPSTYMEFQLISPGKFMMGSEELDRESPIHEVTIGAAFYISKYLVTQKQWEQVMGKNPSYFIGEDYPVEMVSWDDIHEFIKKLNEKDCTDKYRLPSEAEWEYACRACTKTRYHFGDDESKLNEYAWYDKNAWYDNDTDRKTHPIGTKKPNSWELYDMIGNVWEYVQDKYHANYTDAPSDGSAWKDGDNPYRVLRGGCWFNSYSECRSAYRCSVDPKYQTFNLGFRLVREL